MIGILFSILFFCTPLLFVPFTSELFEFNKMVFVYLFTSLIVAVWIIRMIKEKRIIFQRTRIDVVLLLFLFSQIVATVFSIDLYTSLFGYYSRFNGGLLSTICFALLYWSYVSTMDSKATMRVLRALLASGIIISIWAVLEHFGKSPSCLIVTGAFNADCWVQDVQTRVFATLGQPNWLAAYVVALAPIFWKNSKHNLLFHAINLLTFCALLFTKSRSGVIGFIVAYAVFWVLTKKWKLFLITGCYLALAAVLINAPKPSEPAIQSLPALESGGTESGTLRKIVWSGAIEIIKHYPLFGTGVETFAYAYYEFRPVEHNLTSEWDFLYNKAHNEYLNFGANTGLLGLLAYLLFIATVVIWLFQLKQYAFLAGFVSLLITNFFGFSVVATSLLFFLYPAMAWSLTKKSKKVKPLAINNRQKIALAFVILITVCVVLTIVRYWLADIFYTKGKNAAEQGKFADGASALEQAIAFNPFPAIYHDTLAYTYIQAALALREAENPSYQTLLNLGILESDKAIALAPRSTNILKSRANLYADLVKIDEKYVHESITLLQSMLPYAPTDPSIHQRLGLSYIALGKDDAAIFYFLEAIKLKPNYKNARMALAFVYLQKKETQKAIDELTYILSHISPDDILIKSELERIQKGQ